MHNDRTQKNKKANSTIDSVWVIVPYSTSPCEDDLTLYLGITINPFK